MYENEIFERVCLELTGIEMNEQRQQYQMTKMYVLPKQCNVELIIGIIFELSVSVSLCLCIFLYLGRFQNDIHSECSMCIWFKAAL